MKVSKIVTSGKLTKLIAIGSRGTAFAFLSESQLGAIKLNERNAIFAKTDRSAAQLAARNRGEHQECLWADVNSWIQSREQGETFWLGELKNALQGKLVRKASVEIAVKGKTSKLVGYVRRDYTGAESLTKAHKCIAVETTLGRVEACGVKKENGKGTRNNVFFADIQSVK